METRTIKVTLDKAKEWYFSEDPILKELALQAFTKNELEIPTYQQIALMVGPFEISKEEQVLKVLAEYYRKPSDVFKPNYEKWFIGQIAYDGWTVIKHSSVMYTGISYFLREKDAREALNIFLKEMGYDNP
jgi:hypothetical protein